MMKIKLKKFKLTEMMFTPHSLRHGGATNDFLNNVPMMDIVMRGRWQSAKTARRYVQSGRSLQLQMKQPAGIKKLTDELLKMPEVLLRHPEIPKGVRPVKGKLSEGYTQVRVR
jgi:hypothetical protein